MTLTASQVGFDLDVIEMALGHVTRDPNGTAYDRWEFLEEMSHMMQHWADYIDDLRTGETDNVIKMPRKLASNQ